MVGGFYPGFFGGVGPVVRNRRGLPQPRRPSPSDSSEYHSLASTNACVRTFVGTTQHVGGETAGGSSRRWRDRWFGPVCGVTMNEPFRGRHRIRFGRVGPKSTAEP